MLCSSRYPRRYYQKRKARCRPPPYGKPCRRHNAKSPMVLSETVLPPVFGPLLQGAVRLAQANRYGYDSIGTEQRMPSFYNIYNRITVELRYNCIGFNCIARLANKKSISLLYEIFKKVIRYFGNLRGQSASMRSISALSPSSNSFKVLFSGQPRLAQ
jgi:hypothetical protein